LLSYDLVAIRSGMRMRSILQLALDREGYELKPVQDVQSQYTLCALVQAGIGVGLLPRLIVNGIGPRGLASALLTEPQVARQIGVTKRRDQPLQPAAEKLVELLRRELQMREGPPLTAARRASPSKASRARVSAD
jgi:DNA-binding transcriptional LysR family regulator